VDQFGRHLRWKPDNPTAGISTENGGQGHVGRMPTRSPHITEVLKVTALHLRKES